MAMGAPASIVTPMGSPVSFLLIFLQIPVWRRVAADISSLAGRWLSNTPGLSRFDGSGVQITVWQTVAAKPPCLPLWGRCPQNFHILWAERAVLQLLPSQSCLTACHLSQRESQGFETINSNLTIAVSNRESPMAYRQLPACQAAAGASRRIPYAERKQATGRGAQRPKFYRGSP